MTERMESVELAELTQVQTAFGLATTQTEVDPDRRWEAVKLVSEYLGKLRLRASPAGGESEIVTDGSVRQGDIITYKLDPEKGLGEIISHTRPAAAQSSGDIRTATPNQTTVLALQEADAESIDSWLKDNPLPDDAEHPENYRKAFTGTGNTWNGGAPDGYYPQKHVDELRGKIARLEAAQASGDAELGYATRLLQSFVAEHFPHNPDWKPLPDLVGVLMQLDNASTITRDYRAQLEATRKALEPFAAFADPRNTIPPGTVITAGSALARKQITMADCYAARAALEGQKP